MLTTNIALIIAIRFFSGMCFAIVNTSIMSLGTQLTPVARKSEGIAYLATVTMVGWAIGPFIGLNLVHIWSFNGIFIFCSLILLLGLVILFFINTSRLDTVNNNADIGTSFSIHDFWEVRAFPVCSVIFLVGFAYSSITSFVAIYANGLHLLTAGAYYFVILALFSAVARLYSGKVYDRLGANTLIYPCFILFAIGFFLLSYAQTTSSLLTSAVLVGTTFGTITLCTQAIAVHQASEDRTSVVTATYFTFLDFGIGVGSYILGSCIPLLGYSKLYLLLCPFILGISVLYFGVYGRKAQVSL